MTNEQSHDEEDDVPPDDRPGATNPRDRSAAPTLRVTIVESQDGTAWTTPLDAAPDPDRRKS